MLFKDGLALSELHAFLSKVEICVCVHQFGESEVFVEWTQSLGSACGWRAEVI